VQETHELSSSSSGINSEPVNCIGKPMPLEDNQRASDTGEPSERPTMGRRDFLKLSSAGSSLLLVGGDAAIPRWPITKQLGRNSVQQQRRRLVVTSRRVFLSGFHNGPTVRFDRLDPEGYMKKVREAHSDVVIIFTKCHWGYAYYDTKVGVKHPNLQYDLVRRWLEAGHRNGLAVVAYYSGQVDTQSGLKYPYWVGRNADNSPSWVDRHFAWCCHHSPYHEYALGMYHELFSRHEFDGLFIDGLPWLRWLPDPLCYCEWCMARYEKDKGESFFESISKPGGYGRRVEWLQESSLRYLDEIYHVVNACRPGLPIYFNQAGPFVMSTPTLNKASCGFFEGHAYDSFSGLSVASVVLRDWGMPGPQVLIYWAGYDGAPRQVDEFRTAAILAQGVRPMFVTDQQNMPDGRQREGFFEWAGHLQKHVAGVDPFFQELKPITSLGVYFSESTRDYLFADRRPVTPSGPTGLIKSVQGCLELLTRSGYPVGVIPSKRVDGGLLAKYDLICLPETDSLSEYEGRALQDYVASGGKLVVSWKPGLIEEGGKERENFLLADVLGVNFIEEITRFAGRDGPGIYIQPTGHPLSAELGTGELGIVSADYALQPAFCPFIRVHGPAESILDYRLPYMVPNLDMHKVDSWNPAPPGDVKIPQAATVYSFGHGKAVYIGVPIFRRFSPAPNYADVVEPLYWIDHFVRGLIQQLVPDPPLRVTSAGNVRAGFFRKGQAQVMVQIVNGNIWATKGSGTPVQDVQIVGRSDRFSVQSARLVWPENSSLDVRQGRVWKIKVPGVHVHSIAIMDVG
jgi:hypothetical protein